MNYLERVIDEQRQLRYHMAKHEKMMQDYAKKDEELSEVIEALKELPRFKGDEE